MDFLKKILNSLGVYVKVETALGDGQSTYVNLDVYYAPNNLWIGQIPYIGSQPGTTPNVAVRISFFQKIF